MDRPRARSLPSATHLVVQLTTWVSLLVVVITGGTLLLVHHVFASAVPLAAEDLAWVARTSASDVAREGAFALVLEDPELMRRTTTESLDHPEITGVVARTSNGTHMRVAGQMPEIVGGPFTGLPDSPRFLDDSVIVWTTADLDGEYVGDVAVVVSTARLEAWGHLRTLAFFGLVGGCLAAFTMSLLYARWYLAPIVRVSADALDDLATLNATLEARVSKRTEELESANGQLAQTISALRATQTRLVEASRSAGKAEVATEVLHNVGNVLSSVNTSAQWVAGKVKRSPTRRLAEAIGLVPKEADEVAAFFTSDPRGQSLLRYLLLLAEQIGDERAAILKELHELERNVEHINIIISMQQSHATHHAGVIERLSVAEVVDDALRMHRQSFERHGVSVACDYGSVPDVLIDRHRLFQVILNLVTNARHAIIEHPNEQKLLTVSVTSEGPAVTIAIADTGCGIVSEHLTSIFQHGFTTRADGHGFGLHDSANAAVEMGGRLVAASDGPGTGATFTLTVPIQSKTNPDAGDITIDDIGEYRADRYTRSA